MLKLKKIHLETHFSLLCMNLISENMNPILLKHHPNTPAPRLETYDTINYCPDHIYHGRTIFCFGFVETVSSKSKIWNPGWANTELVFEQILDQPVGKSALLVTGTRRRAVMRSNFWTTVGKKTKERNIWTFHLQWALRVGIAFQNPTRNSSSCKRLVVVFCFPRPDLAWLLYSDCGGFLFGLIVIVEV